MKRYYLVKGEERHEVEILEGRYNFTAVGHMITPKIAKLLGYTLEEVDERKEMWTVSSMLGVFWNREAAKHAVEDRGGELDHWVELREGERVLSLEEFTKIWDSAIIQETYAVNRSDKSVVFPKLCRELGFPEGDS